MISAGERPLGPAMFSCYVTYLDPRCRRVSLLIWAIYARYVLRICVVELLVKLLNYRLW